jgi:hypothetical protein
MRWVFIALVLANVAVFIGHSVQSSRLERLEALSSSSEGEHGTVSGAPLILVSELTEQQKLDLAKPQPVAAVAVAATEASVVQAPTSEAAPVSSPVVVEPAPTTKSKPLVSEANQCLRLGPAVGTGQAEQLSQRLMAFTIITDIVDVEVPGKPEYWVVLPPFSDEKTALLNVQELQGRGMKVQIIPKGELANAVSFGLHGQKDAANQQAEELNTKGVKAVVKSVPVMHKEKWLLLSERQTPKLTEELWNGIHADFPKLGKQVKNCH